VAAPGRHKVRAVVEHVPPVGEVTRRRSDVTAGLRKIAAEEDGHESSGRGDHRGKCRKQPASPTRVKAADRNRSITLPLGDQ